MRTYLYVIANCYCHSNGYISNLSTRQYYARLSPEEIIKWNKDNYYLNHRWAKEAFK